MAAGLTASTRAAVAVLGAGAIGSLFAAALAQAGHRVQLLLRPGATPLSDLEFTDLSGVEQRLAIPSVAVSALQSAPDVLLVCTKAQQVATALGEAIPYCNDDTTIVLLHNGMGVLEQLADTVGPHRVFSAVTMQAAHRPAPGFVTHTGTGDTFLGASRNADAAAAEALARQLGTPTCPITPVPDIAPLQWRKLAINCALNPLTALYDCCNGEVGEHPEARLEQQALVNEIIRVSDAMGEEFAVPDLAARLQQVMRDTYPNPNSMRCDIKAGIPTEIEHINGYLVARAEQMGIDAPKNRDILGRIRALEPR